MGIFDYFFMGKSGNKTSETMEAYVEQKKIEKGEEFLKEEFSVETAEEISDYPNDSINSYSVNGIDLEPAVDTLKLTYDGILAKDGAEELDAIIGYGNNLKWEDVETYPMHKTDNRTFELVFSPRRKGNINIAFRDKVGNWDNNSGMNYSFTDDF